MAIHRLEIEVRPGLVDALAEQTRRRLDAWLGLRPARIRTRRVIHLDLGLSDHDARQVLEALIDPVAEIGALGMLDDHAGADAAGAEVLPVDVPVVLHVGLRPGVTDSVGTSVRRAAEDRLRRPLTGRAHSSTLYLLWGLSEAQVREAADAVLHNPLVERARILAVPRTLDLEVPRPGDDGAPSVTVVPLRDDDEDALVRRSVEGMLALSLAEMRAIQQHFRERGRDPTDAELECLAQT